MDTSLIWIIELLAFAVSASALVYGGFHLFRKGIPKFFQLYVYAAGCYMLEELWVIVSCLFAGSGQDELVAVRLFGVFSGTETWYGIDNSNGVFKEGSQFYVR